MKLVWRLWIGSLFLVPFSLLAQTAQFPISVTTADLEAPSTPSLLTATPASQTQIDITWSTATDNFRFGGYVLFRDSTPIATTTLTSFSDTSLTASTTYTYFVQAYDQSFNYSSSSNAIAATTLPPDIIPPSTPTLFSAIPTNLTTIDLSWSTATDNQALFGYVVYRDGIAVATTTATTITDTGLTASTTYTYYIQAVDTSFNYSSSSNSIATTTLSNPPPGQPAQSSVGRPALETINIDTTETTALFSIQTAYPAQIELRWGRTTQYELGYVLSNRFVRGHETVIDSLEPGTTYEFQVIGRTQNGVELVLRQGQFRTQQKEVISAPANVSRFKAFIQGSDVRLSWLLPGNEDVQYIRVVRNHFGFPTFLQDGVVVYQGLATEAFDEGVLNDYDAVYYTAFVVNENGMVSSGAVAFVSADGAVQYRTGEQQEAGIGGKMIVFDPIATTDSASGSGFLIPELSDIYVRQNQQLVTLADAEVRLLSDTPFTIFVPADQVTNNLKTLLLTLVDPTDSRETYTFILKSNQDNSAYEAVIAPLGLVGESKVVLDIYNYEVRQVSTYVKRITFVPATSAVEMVWFPDMFFLYPIQLALASSLLFILILLLIRRRRHTA